ncbi:MAG TPA: hypothetical protein VGP89_17980 [Candidatus Angelobacter sp.]|jgi:hypothetical protein|nr:hypothetical protein [Candidatus Angelobacter sp.]
MKKILLSILAVVCSFTAATAQAPSAGGRILVSRYGAYQLRGGSTVASGAATISFPSSQYCQVAVGQQTIIPIATTIPLKIVDDTSANTETVTPSAVSVSAGVCSFTATFSNAHNSFYVTSGTGGLQEAMLNNPNGGVFLLDQNSTTTDANIKAATSFNPSMVVEDFRGSVNAGAGQPIYWRMNPSAVTPLATPTPAPLPTTTTGALTSNAYKVTTAYVDCLGGVSLDSAESLATATTTGVVIPSPAAKTGACGWLPRISSAGGTGDETLAASPLLNSVCSLSSTETVIPACAIGSAATIIANPTTTAKPSVEANAFATYTLQSFNSLPPPVVTSYPFGVFVATATLNSSNADAAQLGPFPAGYFNKLGGTWKLCVKGGTATQVASSLLTVNIKIANEYAQSPVTISSLAFPTQTQAAAGTFQGCLQFQTSTTGASGKFWASTPDGPWVDFLNTAPATQVVTADASAAASSAVDLTKTSYLSINLQAANANNITVPIVNSVSLVQIQ